MSSWVNSGWQSARRSSSRAQRSAEATVDLVVAVHARLRQVNPPQPAQLRRTSYAEVSLT